MIRLHCIAAAALLAIAGAAAQAQECAWEHFDAPPAYNSFHVLYDVDGVARDDVWAVGRATEYLNFDFYRWTYALHFDGAAWTHVPTPNPDPSGAWNDITGVVALGPDDAIAVGTFTHPDPGAASQCLAMRWDGSDWSLIDTPFIQGGSSLSEIEQVGGDVWAVGSRRNDAPPPATSQLAFSLRWTGSGWEEYRVPPLAEFGRSFNELFALDGVSADDIWAVGQAQQRAPHPAFGPRVYMVHWDGSAWSVVDDDFGAMDSSGFGDVEAIAADDVWAVGWTMNAAFRTQPLIVHYDGAAWTRVQLPEFSPGSAELRAVTARAADDVYAVGTWTDEQGFPGDLILHYDGSTWTQMESAPVNGEHQWYRAATTLTNGDVWIAGQFRDLDLQNTIATTERLSCDAVTPGDTNCDGVIDAFDIEAFVTALTDPNGYAAQYPNCDIRSADANGDGAVDAFDIEPFVNLLVNP